MGGKLGGYKKRRASLATHPSQKKETSDIISISLNPTLVNIPLYKITDFSKLVGIYMQAVSLWVGSCPNCGCPLNKHDSYRRKTPLYGVIFLIKRVYCKRCGKTHALLPLFVFPYSRVMASVKEAAIRGICFETDTIEQLAELCKVEPSTIKRWWKTFRASSNSLLNWLAKELASSTEPAAWLGGDYTSARAKGRKIFELFGLYRSTYHPLFLHSDFDLLCLMKPLIFLPPVH